MAILTTDYNALQARISKILGEGINEFGYGQTLQSEQLATTVPALIPDFTKLRADLLAARYHQIGVPATPPISEITSTITAAQWTQFLTVMTLIESSKLVSPYATQATRIELANEVTPEDTWNNTTTHTITVQFDNYDHMRWFFNTGSAIEFSASSTNTATNAKSVAWNSFLSGFGVISFKQSSTTSTKTTGSTIGFKSLTAEDQIVLKKTKADTPAASIYQLAARKDEESATVTFTIYYINSGANATGILRSIVSAYHASGSYVEISPPSPFSQFEPGVSNPTYTLSRSINTINETNLNVTFTLNTTNFLDGLLYFVVSGTGVSAKDFDPASDLVANTLYGTVEIVSNTGTFTLIPAADLFTEGREQFQVQIKSENLTSSPVLAQLTSLEIITDTSLTPPAPTYTILPLSTTAVTEGQTVLYRIVTKNVKDGTDLYWSTKVITPSLQASDFLDNRLTGVVTVYGNLAELYRTIYEDTLSETTAESYQIVLSVLDPTTGLSKTVQTSELVKITDKVSVEPNIPYVVLADDNSIPEDSTTLVTFTIKTPKLPINTKLYWKTVKDSGVLTANDFTDNTLTGTVIISNNVGIVKRKAKKDALTEGNETFHLSVFSDVGMTNWLVDSDPITIEETVKYELVRAPASMEESTTAGALGAGVTFNLTTPWMPSGTVLYWTTVSSQGVVNADDFTDNTTEGTVVITDNSKGTIFRRAAKDSLVEGTEEFYLEIRASAGTVDPVLVSSQRTTITETVAYEILASKPYIVEDDLSVDFNIKTPFLKNGTILYWDTVSDSGAITASDFADNRLSGTVEINDNVGVITRAAALDILTEGKESFHLILKTGSAISTKVATSAVVTIGETVAYTISLSAPSFIEGQAPITVSFTTPFVTDGTKVYWTILPHAGNITADDFIISDAQGGAAQRLNGYALTTKNKGSFIISARRDTITEEPETFQIQLRIDSVIGPVQVESSLITLNEIIPYTITPSTTLANEGDTVKFTVSTPWIADTEKRQLNWTTFSTMGTVNTTDHPDFTDSISGSVTVTGNSAQIFRTLSKDNFTEDGVKNFGLKLWDTSGTLLATSTVVTMNDTSQTISVPEPAAPTYSVVPRKSKIIEGESVIFDIITENVLPATPLYWSTIRSANLADGSLLQTQSASPVYITYDNPGTSDTAGHGTITITSASNNNKVEGDRMFLLVLRTGSVNGTEVATSAIPVMLVDATPYIIKRNNATITEGSQTGVRFDISTPDSAFGTNMTYYIVPENGSNITSDDFEGLSSLTGTVAIDQNGLGNFTLKAAANSPKEFDESFHIELSPQGSSTRVTLGVPSPIVTITETAVYTLTSTTTNNSVMEGSAATFTFSTPKLINDTVYAYRIVGVGGNIDGADFSPAGLTGQFTVTSAASSYNLSLLTSAGGAEGSEQFQLEISLASTGQLINLTGGSPTITITKNTPYTISPTAGSVQEGNKIAFNVTTPQLSVGTQLLCVITPSTPGAIAAADFVEGSLTPRVLLTTPYSGTLELTTINDNQLKGSRPFTVKLYNLDESSFVTSTPVTITDPPSTAPTPGPTATWSLQSQYPSYIISDSIQLTLSTSTTATADRSVAWTMEFSSNTPFGSVVSTPSGWNTATSGTFTIAAGQASQSTNIPTPTNLVSGIVGYSVRFKLTINDNTVSYNNNTLLSVILYFIKPIDIYLDTGTTLIHSPASSQAPDLIYKVYVPSYYPFPTIKVFSQPDAYTPTPAPFTVESPISVPVAGNAATWPPATGKISDVRTVTGSNLLNQPHTLTYELPSSTNLRFSTGLKPAFTLVGAEVITVSANKPSISGGETVRFTFTIPSSVPVNTTISWRLEGVDFARFGLSQKFGSRLKDSSNSFYIDYTAVATQSSVGQFYLSVDKAEPGKGTEFQSVSPNVTISVATRTISISSIKNGNGVDSTSITMPLSTATGVDKATGNLVITATVNPAFANQSFTCTIANPTHASVPAALSTMTGSPLASPATVTSNGSSQVIFEFKSIYRSDITASKSFQVAITSVSEPACTVASTTLSFIVPNTPAPPVVYTTIMTVNPAAVDVNKPSTLSISGGKPYDTGKLVNIPTVTGSSPQAPITTDITLSSSGTYTAQVGSWSSSGTQRFSASFTASTSCNGTLVVNALLPSPIIASIQQQPSKITVGDTVEYAVLAQFSPTDLSLPITITIETNNSLIRQSLGANTTTGVLPHPSNGTSIFKTTSTLVSVGLKAIPVNGLSGYLAFQVKFTTTNPNTNLPLFVSTTDITLDLPVSYTNTLTLETSSNATGLALRILFTGKPNSNVVISCVGVVTVKTNQSVFSGKLDATGNGVIVYEVENTAYPSPSPFRTMSLGAKGNIVATFADGATITKGFAIKGAFQGTVTPPAGVPFRGVAVGAGGGGGASMEIGGWNGSSGGGGGAGGISAGMYVGNGTAVTLSGGNGGAGGIATLTKIDSHNWVSVAPTDGGNSTITYQGSNLIAYGGKAGGKGFAWVSIPTPAVPQGGAGGNGTSSNGGAGGNGMFDNKGGASTNTGAPGGVNADGVGGVGAGGASPTVSEGANQSSWAKKPGIPGNDGRAMVSWIDLSNTAPIVPNPPVTSPPHPVVPQTTTVTYPKFGSRTIGTNDASYSGSCYWEDLNIVAFTGYTFLISCDDSGSVKVYNSGGQVILSQNAVYNWSTFTIPSNELIEKIEITYADGSNHTGRGILAAIKDTSGTVLWDQSYPAKHYI